MKKSYTEDTLDILCCTGENPPTFIPRDRRIPLSEIPQNTSYANVQEGPNSIELLSKKEASKILVKY